MRSMAIIKRGSSEYEEITRTFLNSHIRYMLSLQEDLIRMLINFSYRDFDEEEGRKNLSILAGDLLEQSTEIKELIHKKISESK